MLRFARLSMSVAPALLFLAACGSDSPSGPSGNGLNTAQRTQLQTLMLNPAFTQAMLSSSPVSAYAGSFLPFMALNLQSVGSFTVAAPASLVQGASANAAPQGSYTAFGGQILITVKQPTGAGADVKMVWTGIIGVNDLSNPTDIISVGFIDDGATAGPTSVATTTIGTTVGSRIATASYMKVGANNTFTSYAGNAGSMTISSASFSGGTNCPGIALQPMIKSCSYAAGTLNGSFDFTAKKIGGTELLVIPTTTVSLPSTRFSISMDLSSAFVTALGR